MIGKCEDCGATTSSGSYKLCKDCAAKKGICGMCGKATKEYLCPDCKGRFVMM